MEKNVAVIGAGLTGLILAYYLKQQGINFKIYEKSSRVGGVIRTILENGFIFETGPNTGTISNIETVELFESLSDILEIKTANEAAKKRLILKNNMWEALPDGILSGISTPLFSLKDKFRLLGEPFRKAGNEPFETVSELVMRRMGKSFLDYAVDPFISGIYAGDPGYLVTKYALPKLYNLEQEYGSFIGGAFKKAKNEKPDKRITKKIFSAEGGLSDIINALAEKIGKENIWLNQNIKIDKNGDKYRIGAEEYTHVASTVNATEAADLSVFADLSEFKDITNLKYAKVAEIALGFKNWKGINLNAFGGLIPSKENKSVLGILFMSSLFNGRAPENGALITSFVGGTKNEALAEMSENLLIEKVGTELKELLGLSEFKPDLLKVFYYKKAIAQYGADSEKRLAAIEKFENRHKKFFLAGSLRDGIGMADRIKQGTEIAKMIIDD